MSELDIDDILRILPHRYPFLLVDRIADTDNDTYITGIKNVSFNEQYFQGHFPRTTRSCPAYCSSKPWLR